MISNDTKRQLVLDDIDPLTYNEFEVRKRDGRTLSFQPDFIRVAVSKAFAAEREIADHANLSAGDQSEVNKVTESVIRDVVSRAVRGEQLEIELIQDAV